MSDKPGDGDLDVDAAWAQIVAHWHTDDLRVVTDDDPGSDAAPAGATAAPAPGEDPGRDAAAVSRAETAPDVRPAGPAADPGPAPPAQGAIGRSRRRDDDVPGLGWDAIRSHVGDEEVRSPARGEDRPDADDRPDDRPDADRPARRRRAADHDPALAALDEHFVPPDPPSLHPGDPVTVLAWLGALGGPLFLLVAALVWRHAPVVLIGAAVLAFVAGFVTLVVRMPDERDDSDDGAVV